MTQATPADPVTPAAAADAPAAPAAPHGTAKRVVILGGGVGGVTAAFALTQPELRGRYDVTLYQMGWRLGGKGASGRNPGEHQRIEEHGLHIWLGFYHHAFALMKQCYDELGRDPAAPLGSFEKAFIPQSLGTLMDNGPGALDRWERWDIEMPRTTDTLTGGEQPSALGYAEMMLQWLAEVGLAELKAEVAEEGVLGTLWRAAKAALHGGGTLAHDALQMLRDLRHGRASAESVRGSVLQAAGLAQQHAHRLLQDGRSTGHRRRVAQVVDIACATLRGLYASGVLTEGRHFQTLDDQGLLDFLREHGCAEASLDAPLLRGYFDLAFGFKRGEMGRRHENAAAGTAIYAILRVCFEYRGAFMWRMAAGMGDTIFAPYHEVLRRRGVRFRFFHRVTALEAGTDPASGQPRVERVHLARQVDLHGGPDSYEPLVDVKGLPCWPSVPRFEQIVQGEALRNGPGGQPFDLESRWSGWTDVDPDVVLHADDFDHLVLAIPVGAHPVICRSLMQASPRFAQMVQQVQTVQTFGVQLWLDREVEALGWATPSIAGQPQRAVCDAYADPLNSFADNTHLIPLEDWGDTAPPRTLLYFCGPLPDEGPPLWFAPAEDTGFPARQHQRVKDLTLDWLARHTRGILPGACPPASPALDWALLHDDQGRSGPARLDAQYWCANVDPSERYVLSVAGSTRWRLRAGDSQFANLVLAGDWVDNGFAVGCVESATLGGLQAAQAITGIGAGAPLPAPGLGRLAQLGTAGAAGATAATSATGATAPATPAQPATRTLPRFVPMLADLELPPPYEFRNLTIRSFPLRADPVRLQQAVDRLNIAPPEVCEVRAISNLVFMQLAQYPYLQSQPDPEGWFTENELGFAIPVAIGRRVNGLFVPERVAYHFAMFFVDNDFAIATGREVFGYPKVASEMRFGAPGDPTLLTVDTLALQRRASTEPARKLRLVEVSETRHRSGLAALLAEIKGLAADLGDLVLGPAGLLDQGSPALWKAVLQTFGRSEIGIVSLKQFRDAADPSRACYQALVLSSFQIHTWHQRGLLAGDYSARIADDASMPIVDAFGLQRGADGRVPTMQPFAMRFDCTLGVGTNLWVAP